jgi:SAM-dependent methyltransferase
VTDPIVRRRYTEVADIYIRTFGAIADVAPEDLSFVALNFGRCHGEILDAGCGPGHLTAYLTDLGLTARGIDLVPVFVDHARSNWPNIDFAIGSLHALDVPDRSLGGILAWYSLIHCEPTSLTAVLAEFRRILSRGAILVVGFFDGDDVEAFDHKVTTAYRWPVERMSRMLSRAGFVEVDRAQRAGTDRTRRHAALAVRAG